jgi:hypothetical protein
MWYIWGKERFIKGFDGETAGKETTLKTKVERKRKY